MLTKEKNDNLIWRDFLWEAYLLAARESKDRSTQNAALIVDGNKMLIHGVNNFPDGVKETEARLERPLKYRYVEHAERAVLYRAAKLGIRADGLTMVCCWATCCDCARAIIASGIKTLVTHKQAYNRSPERWKQDIDVAIDMLNEAGIEVIWYDGKVTENCKVLHSGELWEP